MKEVKVKDLDLQIERKSYSKYMRKRLRRRKVLKVLGEAATAFALTIIVFLVVWLTWLCDKTDACGAIFIWCVITFLCAGIADWVWEDFDPDERII